MGRLVSSYFSADSTTQIIQNLIEEVIALA